MIQNSAPNMIPSPVARGPANQHQQSWEQIGPAKGKSTSPDILPSDGLPVVITTWPILPKAMKAGIVAMVGAFVATCRNCSDGPFRPNPTDYAILQRLEENGPTDSAELCKTVGRFSQRKYAINRRMILLRAGQVIIENGWAKLTTAGQQTLKRWRDEM